MLIWVKGKNILAIFRRVECSCLFCSLRLCFLIVISLAVFAVCGFLFWLNCGVWEIDPIEMLESNTDVRRLLKAAFILEGTIFMLASLNVAPRPLEPILKLLFFREI